MTHWTFMQLIIFAVITVRASVCYPESCKGLASCFGIVLMAYMHEER